MFRRSANVVLASALGAAALTVGIHASTGIAQAADSGTCPVAAGSYAGGTGTPGDPYLISTPEQLQRLRDQFTDWTAEFTLTTDIDMGGCIWGSTIGDPGLAASGWTGKFDGGSHTVSGLDISLVGEGYGGFIAYLGGGSLTGLGFTGDVTVSNSGTGSVFAYAGGLVGFTLGVSISESFATGTVTANVSASADGNGDAEGDAYTGGLVGYSQGDISDAYATGDVVASVTATASGAGRADVVAHMGGLIGWKPLGDVSRSYSTGAPTYVLSATGGFSRREYPRVGGFSGFVTNVNGTSTANAWDVDTSGRADAVSTGSFVGITGLTTAQMQDYSSFASAGLNWPITDGYSTDTTWSMCDRYNSGLPFLSGFAPANACNPAAYAAIDSIDAGTTASFVTISGANTSTTTDDSIYVADDSVILVYPPLATSQDSPSVLQVGSPIESIAVTDDTIYVATTSSGSQFNGVLSFPVGTTGAASPSSSSAFTPEPSALAVGGQGTASNMDDSVYVVAYNGANGIFQLTPSLDDSAFTAFSIPSVQPGAIQISGAQTTSTSDDTVYVRGNGLGSGSLVEMTPALDDSVSASPLGFSGSNFLMFDEQFLFSSNNKDRVSRVNDLDDSDVVDFSSWTGAVTSSGVWLGINFYSGIVGVGPASEASKTSIIDLGYPFGYQASTAAASDNAFYVVGGAPTMSVVDKITAGFMSPTSGDAGTTVTIPLTVQSGRLMDDSTVTDVSWGGTSIPFTRVVGQNTIEVEVPNIYGTVDVKVELNGGSSVSMGSFTGPSNPTPPAPTPASAPSDVVALSGDQAAFVSWSAPASSGSFPISTYQVSGAPAGSCVAPALELSCEILGLTNGAEYSFRVRALTGAGWGAWSEPVTVVPAPPATEESILISGVREGGQVRVSGVTTGLVGSHVTPWFRFPGQSSYAEGTGVRTVSTDGTFTWQRKTRKKIYVYFRAADNIRSNRLIIPAR